MTSADQPSNGPDDKKKPNKKKSKFRKITKEFKVQGGALREKPKVIVARSGASEGNVAMTDLWDEHAILRGLDPNGPMLMAFGVDDEREVISLSAATELGPGVTTIKRIQRGASARLRFHLGAVFADSPGLRPKVRLTECLVLEEIDEETDLPVLVIPIKTGTAVTPKSRGRKQSTTTPAPVDQAAATDDFAELDELEGLDETPPEEPTEEPQA